MKPRRSLPKIMGHMLFASAVYSLPGLPAEVLKRRGSGWVVHIPDYLGRNNKVPEWLQAFIDQKQVYPTRRELIADLDTALELAESKAQQSVLNGLL